MAVMMLEGLGYTVFSAASPEEALRVAEERGGAIQLLISDVVMPGMNGLELSRRVRSRFPGVRVMLMSGYTANVIARHGALDRDMSFVAKPFSVHELAAKVREALEEENAAPGFAPGAAPGFAPGAAPGAEAALPAGSRRPMIPAGAADDVT
jgi:CheY-like chemotaxis protein